MTTASLRCGVAAAALLLAPLPVSTVQAQTSDPALSASQLSGPLQEDVSMGRLTAEQAGALQSQFFAAQDTMARRMEAARSRILASSSAQGVNQAVDSMIAGVRQSSTSGLGEATDGLIDTISAGGQLQLKVIREVGPVMQEYLEAVDALSQQRAEFIAQNPNISREQKLAVQREAARIHQQVSVVIPRLMAESTTRVEERVAQVDNNRNDAKDQAHREIERRRQQYGDDPANWPTQPPATPAAQQPTAPPVNPAPTTPAPRINPPATNPPVASRDPVSGANPRGGNGSPGRGTVPGDASSDPAFRVTQQQTTTPTNVPSPNGAARRPASGGAGTTSANDPAFDVNRNGQVDRPPAPPPPPGTNPLDDLRPIQHIDPMPPAGQTGTRPPNALETRASPGTSGTPSGQRPNQGDAGIPVQRPQSASNPSGPSAVAGALAGAAASDPLSDLRLPPLGNAGRGVAGQAGGDGSSGGDGGGGRLSPADRLAAAQGDFSPADAFNSAARLLSNIQNNGIMQVATLAGIYTGYDPNSAPGGRSFRSLSAAPTSLPLDWHLPSVNDALQPAFPGGLRAQGENVQSYFNAWTSLNLYGDPLPDRSGDGINTGRVSEVLARSLFDYSNFPGYARFNGTPLSEIAPNLVAGLYGLNLPGERYQIQRDPTGRNGRINVNARYVASLFDDDARYLRALASNDIAGLDRLLAQPFNVVLTWGERAYDLDLHMTGPTGEGQTDRFHIFYTSRGDLNAFPFAELITDCICSSGSEVILTSALLRGGVYRISAFNFGDQSATSTNLSSQSEAILQIVRGGVAVPNGDGTIIVGGRVIYSGSPPPDRQGNTWTAVEINAQTGRIFATNSISQSAGSGAVE